MRNLIHGADTVMSHILHFYHLAAADFVDISPAPGILGSPFDDGQRGPAFGSLSSVQMVSLTQVNTLNDGITKQLVESYVRALDIRRKAHSMSAIFMGRHPIGNAIVPGGVSTIFNSTDIVNFRSYLNETRNFINKFYIPDVVFVASRSTGFGWTTYWSVGTNPGTAVSYGEYPLAGAEAPFNTITDNSTMLLSRGVVTYGNPPALGTFYSASIAEHVDYSYYSSLSQLHPSVGATTPLSGAALQTALDSGQQYSWLKAPRYNGLAAEVGPLARMVATYLDGANTNTVTENQTYSLGNIAGGLTLPPAYTVNDLVGAALTVAGNLAGTTLSEHHLFSPLGRHACRALECKFVADAMYSWLDDLTLQHASGTDASDWSAYTTAHATGSGYVYKEIPRKQILNGEGLAEAPRGALGHWIKINDRTIANYQCVVPSTWNCSPKDDSANYGPAESALVGVPAAVGGNTNDAIVNIARMLHPYDFCIACAVHVVKPDGSEISKFKMDLDGGIKKL
jgi:hydrogenase large subunit